MSDQQETNRDDVPADDERRPDRETLEARLAELEERNDALEAELERKEMIAKQIVAAAEATEDVNRDAKSLADDIVARIDGHASNVEAISSEVGNLSSSIQEVASMTQQARAGIETTADLTRDGQRSGAEAIERMETVDDAATQVTADLETLKGHIAEIDEFVVVIDDVADRTNTLALNASIEATRAGEAGASFSVVADEIKQLAEASRGEASKIESLVAEIQDETAATKESLNRTTTEQEDGREAVRTAMTTMEEIAERVQDVETAIQEVSEVTDDQASTAGEIHDMMDELDGQASSVAADAGEITGRMDDQLENVEMITDSANRLAK